MKSKTKKSCDRKSTASRGQGSAQHHRLTSGARTPSPPHHETTPLPSTTAVVVLSPDASPLPAGGQSLTVRIASKTLLGRKSCEPAGNGHPLREGSEVTGSEPVGTSVVLAGGSDTSAPEVVEGPEMKQRMMMSVDGGSGCSSSSSSSNHQTPPTKRMKMMMTRETQPSSSSSLSSAERCNAGVLTDPDCLGPCDPGSSVILEGIVWNESRNGLLVVNVTWRGKTYVGTLMDSTNHNWASPSFKEDSLSTTDNNNSSSRDEDGGGGGGVAMAPEGRRLRRCRTMQPGNGVTGVMTTASASAASSSSASTTSSTASSKTSTTRTTKCRVQVGDNAAVQTDPVNLQQTLNGVGNGGDAGILCPELHCQRRFKHESALRNHRFRAHKATTDSIATSTFATSSAATSAAATSSARSIVDDCVGSALTTTAAAQSKGPSLLLHAKQRCFDGDEDVSSGGGGCRGIKKTEDDGARLCITEEKDGDDGVEAEEEEEDCSSSTLIRSASSGMMENNKLDCFVLSSSSSRCLQSTMPIVCSGSVQMLSCGAKLASSTAAAAAEMENGTGETTALDSSDCAVSDGAVPMRDGAECTTVVCADRQKMRNGAKKHCKGRLDRGGVQKNSEAVVSSACVASQMLLGQSSTTVVGEEASAAGGSAAGTSAAGASATGASVAGASATGALLSLHSSEDKHCAKRLKTNGGMPFSMLSVSLNRIPMENNESSLTRKMVPATETRSDDRLQDAERSGSSSCSAAVDSVRGLGLDVAKLCIVSGFGSSPGREPSAGKTPSQSLFAMRGEVMGRYPPEKTQVDNSKCHLVKSGNMHTEEIGKPQLESSCVVSTPGKGQNGSDSQTSSDRALTPSKLVFQSSKTCHDKLLAPGVVRDGNQKQTGLHSSSSFMFGAADSSKSILNHVGKESTLVSHLSYVDKTKPELSTSSAKGIPTSAFSLRNSTGESIGSQAAKQKCPSFSNPDQAIIPDRGCTAISSSAVSSGGSGGPTVYAKDIMMMCDLNSFTSNNVQKDFSDLKGALPSRSTTIPFAVPMGSRSIPNGNLAWTTSPFVSSMSSLQHTTTRSKASSSDPPSPLTSRGSTYVTALASSMSSSALTADCSFVPFCRAIQGAPATTTSLPKQTNKFCAPPPSSPPLASCPLEANTASEVFVRRDDGSWTSASGGKSAQQQQQQQQQQQHAMISNSSCPDRNLLVCGDISLPLPLQSPLSSSSGLSSSSATDLHHVGVGGVIPYQQKKEKMLSALHSSAMKPPQSSSSTSSSSSSSRSLLTGHSVQAACPK